MTLEDFRTVRLEAVAEPSATVFSDELFTRLLVAMDAASEEAIDTATIRARSHRTPLQDELIADGDATADDTYRALAILWGAPLVKAETEPPDLELLGSGRMRHWLTMGWVPWQRLGPATVMIATSVAPSETLLAAARRELGAGTVLVRTITPRDLDAVLARGYRDELLYEITDAHADARPDESARPGLSWWQKALPLALPPLVIAAAFGWTSPVIVSVFLIGNALFYFFVLFKGYLSLRSWLGTLQRRYWERSLDQARRQAGLPERRGAGFRDDVGLPMYTILVPVYHEANIVAKLVSSLGRLDYPKSRLQVLLLLEEDDMETIAAARAADPPAYVSVLIVPDGQPRTKPRACNYGLAFARGEFVVIFDAEDVPDPQQLRTAVEAFDLNRFERAHIDPSTPELACTQAALAYFNADYNLLTRLFAIEYAHWFDAMLPGMDGSGIPIPLGGTSNHFRTDTLRDLGGWDPYNVTEDADLGLRISNRGYAVGTIASSTQEEACSETPAWIRQRTRWIKGYMITSAVNLKHPIRFLRRNGIGGAMSMGLLVAGTPLSFMLYPVALLFTLVTWLGVQFGTLHFPVWLLQASLLVMVVGVGMLIVTSAMVARRRYGWRIAIYAPLIPIYWLLHSVAAWRAAYQALFDPHRWEKTPHGLGDDYEGEAVA